MSDVVAGITVNEERASELLERGGAYTAAEVARETVEKKKPYRRTKIEKEGELK